jgi:hypothetical protein
VADPRGTGVIGPNHARRPAGRRSSLRVRRRRALVALVLAVLVIVVVLMASSSGSPHHDAPTSAGGHQVTTTAGTGIPAVEAGVLPWGLDQTLSREVVLPGRGPSVTVVGGLGSANQSSPRIFSLDTANGTVTDLGQLAQAVHDAAGATLGGHVLVLGGGSPATIPAVERFVEPTAGATVTGTVVGQLPSPRSDSSAVTIGHRVYVVGGYDGTNADPQVLSTPDGQHFAVVTTLKVPVRYPAVVGYDHRIFVIGGQAVGGADAGHPVDTVQVVDPATNSDVVVGRLPHSLAGAVAAVVGGHLYVAGGVIPASGASTTATGEVMAFEPGTHRWVGAGTLPVPVAYSAAQVVGDRAWLVGGEDGSGTPLSSVEMFTPNFAFGTAGARGAGSPYFGDRLLVADRGNNRLLLLDDTNHIVWNYPSATAAAPPGGFYFPDDAFFARNGTEIISNQEENETIVILGFPSGKVLWQYGHPHQPGTAPGYLHEPDDAYLLKNGQVTVADAMSCRILFFNLDKTLASQIGTANACTHQPPTELGSPNGDTPLGDGNVLVSEITGQWISEYTPAGKLVWTVHLPIGYPSDPQQLGPDLYIVSDYSQPGGIVEFNRAGQILYHYAPPSGQGALNQPSLTEVLPSGVFMANDDYRHRMVAIDPATQALVWQYGVTDTPGTAPGYLNIPDGFDLLLPNGSTPTHPVTG